MNQYEIELRDYDEASVINVLYDMWILMGGYAPYGDFDAFLALSGIQGSVDRTIEYKQYVRTVKDILSTKVQGTECER